MTGGLRVLSDGDAEHFMQRGYVVVRDAIPREFLAEQSERMWVRLGYDPADRLTWTEADGWPWGEGLVRLGPRDHWDASVLAPKAWSAAVDLLGGEERIAQPWLWSDALIVNLGVMADAPWTGPTRESPGWHKDGDFFHHFLDSPEQALLTLVLWTDMRSQGGATFIVPDSIRAVARFLAARPQGISYDELRDAYPMLLRSCSEFIEVEGRAGDVVFLHPYMIHATSQNVRRDARAVTNPALHLKQPMQFSRPDPRELSLVERTVLRSLGRESFDFKIQGERRGANPSSKSERLEAQHRREPIEDARLLKAGLPLHVSSARHATRSGEDEA